MVRLLLFFLFLNQTYNKLIILKKTFTKKIFEIKKELIKIY